MPHPTDPSVVRRFMAKVALPDDPADCWIWLAGRRGLRKEYGAFRLNNPSVPAHRVAYEMFVGPIPEGLFIDHMCFIKLCVNPRHLRAVTNKHNQENRRSAMRTATSRIRGVSWVAARRAWRVQVVHYSVNHYGGLFRDLAEAEAAAIELRNRLFTHNDADRVA